MQFHVLVAALSFISVQATFDAKQSIEYGTKIVGGVRPGKHGEHLGLPVLPTMRAVGDTLIETVAISD